MPAEISIGMGHDEVIIGPLKEAHHPSLAPDDEMSSSAESQREASSFHFGSFGDPEEMISDPPMTQ